MRYAHLKLGAMGMPVNHAAAESQFLELAGPLLRNYYQRVKLLGDALCPVDARIQAFLDRYLADATIGPVPHLPANTLVLDRPGLARVLSLPPDGDAFASNYVHSYRVPQGVLHNPKSDRRTTQGIFHIVEGGLPIPADKIVAPRKAFAVLLESAFHPPDDDLVLPFTADQETKARLFVSLLLRPLVCPATGASPEKNMETRFFAPASLVSNLDFVERIFGNGGEPFLPENDAALDPQHWTGHTGCVILAPHLTSITKQFLGLPHYDQASARQRNQGMCWKSPDELYNDGRAFKICCRDASGVIVTIIADNYFGYCKKEVKTQISFAANLYGLAEEEHAGGSIAFPSYILGQDFHAGRTVVLNEHPFADTLEILNHEIELKPEGYAIDRTWSDVVYLPEDTCFSVRDGFITWVHNGQPEKLRLRAGYVYILPSGYRVHLAKQPGGAAWRLIGTRPEATLIHKPCTVSGGGKSEISKSIANAILKGPIFVADYHKDMDHVARILQSDFSRIHKQPPPGDRAKRPILSPERSLGSVIKLLTPSPDYVDEYNERLRALPGAIRQLLCTIKRYYRPEWGDHWREHFTVDRINGQLGHELRFDDEILVGNYLRVGFDPHGSWRVFKLRPDFHPAAKVQVEDDISVSVVVPRHSLPHLDPEYTDPSLKLVENCERMLFQRPDEAIHRGFDKEAEADLAATGSFLSNFEPLTAGQVHDIVDHIVEFDKYSDPMRSRLEGFFDQHDTRYAAASDQARLVDGKPSKNPRYLQPRPDLAHPRDSYLATVAARLHRGVHAGETVFFPVNAVMAGRRGNRADAKLGVPPLAAYNPIHYQELPELFMDFICSLTGKSPSTTGFGSEGALTKRPFNALLPIIDVNNALVAAILTGYAGFTTSAGYIGPKYRVDHDVSLLVPEIWCRMRVSEREPRFLIENGYLEKVDDFEHHGRTVAASRLGYRITSAFADRFLGRIFETPDVVFPEEILRPEKQDLASFVAGIDAIVESQKRVAMEYFEDGSVEAACPPIKALLHIMAYGQFEGGSLDAPRIREMFSRDALISSDWYQQRLRTKQAIDIAFWSRYPDAKDQLARVSAPSYFKELYGTIGADPSIGPQSAQ